VARLGSAGATGPPRTARGRAVRVLLAGAGAVGSWLGAVLARGGVDVALVARGAHLEAIRRDGLGVAGLGGAPIDRLAIPAFGSVAEAARTGPFDAVIVAVRSFDTEALGRELADCPRLGPAVSFQNGVGNEAVLTATLAGRRVPDAGERPLADASGALAGTLTMPVWIEAPGVVATGPKGGAGIAAARPGQVAVRDGLVAGFVAGGLRACAYDDGPAMKWSKLALNLLGAATSALLGRPPSSLLTDRRWFGVERAVLREALAVMRALDLHPVALPGYPVPMIAALARALPERALYAVLARRFAAGRSDRLPGLAADVAAGRAVTEIDALHGAVAATGAVLGVHTPVCQRVRDLVAVVVEGRVPLDAFAGNPARLLEALTAP